MIDISNQETLMQYLLDKGHVKPDDTCSITYLGGGVSGTVAFLRAGGREMIVKQALAKLKVAEEWLCDPSRMYIEMKSNEIYHRLVPDNAPAVYFYDHDNYIFGREAAPEHAVMWKSNLMSGLLDFEVAEKVMRSLVVVHNECAKDKDVAEIFGDKTIFYELRISPYIKFILQKHPRLEGFAAPIIDELMSSQITLVHGDYSPKNVMLEGRKVYITDFEVAHYGHPSFDIAFLSNHLVLKALHNRRFGASAYLSMLRYILDVYFGEMDYMDKSALETSFVKLLPLLMIARVDGKSPVEYIIDPAEKEIVRGIAYAIIEGGITTREDMLKLVQKKIDKI